MEAALPSNQVLHFSRALAGPCATTMLSDLGAHVMRIERPGTGDDTRKWGPSYDEAGDATYFRSVNRNKQSLTLDLSDPADLDRAQQLALEADVLMEKFRPGPMDQDNPRLIYCSITGSSSGCCVTRSQGSWSGTRWTSPPTSHRRPSASSVRP